MRPSLVVLDDPQTDESARSLSQCANRESILAGAVLGLAGPGKKISGIMPCTVKREDAEKLAEQIKGRSSYWETRTNDPPSRRPLRFEALAIEAMDKGLMGTGKFAEYMGISRREAMKLLDERADKFWQEESRVEIEVIDS